MQYRTHDDSPLTTITVEPGAVIVTLLFDRLAASVRLHRHSFDHEMQCVKGMARIVIDDEEAILRPGDKYTVAAHKQHGVHPLALDTELRCVHYHPDIHPDRAGEGIPLEWLRRLTDEDQDARG